jgi:hypothetical protein
MAAAVVSKGKEGGQAAQAISAAQKVLAKCGKRRAMAAQPQGMAASKFQKSTDRMNRLAEKAAAGDEKSAARLQKHVNVVMRGRAHDANVESAAQSMKESRKPVDVKAEIGKISERFKVLDRADQNDPAVKAERGRLAQRNYDLKQVLNNEDRAKKNLNIAGIASYNRGGISLKGAVYDSDKVAKAQKELADVQAKRPTAPDEAKVADYRKAASAADRSREATRAALDKARQVKEKPTVKKVPSPDERIAALREERRRISSVKKGYSRPVNRIKAIDEEIKKEHQRRGEIRAQERTAEREKAKAEKSKPEPKKPERDETGMLWDAKKPGPAKVESGRPKMRPFFKGDEPARKGGYGVGVATRKPASKPPTPVQITKGQDEKGEAIPPRKPAVADAVETAKQVQQKVETAKQAKPEPAKGRGTSNRYRKADRIRRLRIKAKSGSDDPNDTNRQPGWIGRISTDKLAVDADTYQFRQIQTNTKTGVAGNLAGVKTWDDDLAGIVSVWKNPKDGKTYIVNGHHRHALATELGQETLAVRYIKADNPKEARAKGAMVNIAEGRADSIDGAKFFRDTGIKDIKELEQRGIPLQMNKARESIALANLSDPVFDRVAKGKLDTKKGAIIGNAGLEPESQMAVVKKIDEDRTMTNSELAELVDDHKFYGTRKKDDGPNLFGETESESVANYAHKLNAAVRERLSTEQRKFGAVADEKSAELLSRAGNQIDVEESGRLSEVARQNLAAFDMAKRTNIIRSVTNDYSEKFAAAKGRKEQTSVKAQYVEDVMKRLQKALDNPFD